MGSSFAELANDPATAAWGGLGGLIFALTAVLWKVWSMLDRRYRENKLDLERERKELKRAIVGDNDPTDQGNGEFADGDGAMRIILRQELAPILTEQRALRRAVQDQGELIELLFASEDEATAHRAELSGRVAAMERKS